MNKCEWAGSESADDGVATFGIEGHEVSLRLECFADFQKVRDMIDEAYIQGRRRAAAFLGSKIELAMNEVATSEHRYAIRTGGGR